MAWIELTGRTAAFLTGPAVALARRSAPAMSKSMVGLKTVPEPWAASKYVMAGFNVLKMRMGHVQYPGEVCTE